MTKRLRTAYIKITVYFTVLVLATYALVSFFPGIEDYLPVGASEKMFSVSQYQEIESSVHAGRLHSDSSWDYALFFLLCFLSAILVAIPVGQTYMGTHNNKKSSASLAKIIIGLPVVVTGFVLIVQNSLALAFSLAGIVAGAGIRFRTNLKDLSDTLFFLITIGIGLSAGVGAIGISFMMSLVFCYTILTLNAIGYGEGDQSTTSVDPLQKDDKDEQESAHPSGN